MQEQEYRIDVKIRNNLLVSKIEATGMSLPVFCKTHGLSYVRVLDLCNLKLRPTIDNGDYSALAYSLCDALLVSPDMLFSENQKHMELKENKRQVKVAEAELKFQLENTNSPEFLEDSTFKDELSKLIFSALESLTTREAGVITKRFGLFGETEHTLEETANLYEVTRERIRQIEAKAMRKLRHSSRLGQKKYLIDCGEVELTDRQKRTSERQRQLDEIKVKYKNIENHVDSPKQRVEKQIIISKMKSACSKEEWEEIEESLPNRRRNNLWQN